MNSNLSFHFIGIGGIGMSALARICLQKGYLVQGSDLTQTDLLKKLQEEGAHIQIGHSIENIPASGTVIYNSEIKPTHVERKRAEELRVPLLHRSEMLHLLTKGQRPLLVTGSHGKTTTTALLTHVLLEAKLDPSFIIGGLFQGTNGQLGKGAYFVMEADESDGSFLRTKSWGAIVTNLDREHLAHWGKEENLSAAFVQFCHQVENSDALFWCADHLSLSTLKLPGLSYGFSSDSDWIIDRFDQKEAGISFDLTCKNEHYPNIDLSLLGKHNAQNGAAVFALARRLHIKEEVIRKAFASFPGVARRLEWVGEAQNIRAYDDYGHHPTEIKATLHALRARIREHRLVVLFQPHRFTRTQDLFQEFVSCFDEADLLILTDVYSAGETYLLEGSVERLHAAFLHYSNRPLHYFSRASLVPLTAPLLKPGDVVVTFGAGDITHVGKALLEEIDRLAPTLQIALLTGGHPTERAVALRSAHAIQKGLDPKLYRSVTIDTENYDLELLRTCDVCIPVLHGPQGEDGMVQGLLESLRIPYVGCRCQAAGLTMQKAWTKHLAVMEGIPTAPYVAWNSSTPRALFKKSIERELSYPLWIKPVHLGSSVGVSRVNSKEELDQAINQALQFDTYLIAEKHIEGRQIEFGILGNHYLRIGPPGEILGGEAFYDYEAKYGPHAKGVQIPANITSKQATLGQSLALQMYRAAECTGLARIDFFLDREGHYWFNEINPFPGFTETSMYPKIWEAMGMSISDLCNELITLALHRSRL